MRWVEKWVGITKDGIYNGHPDGDFPGFLTNLEPLNKTYPELKEYLHCAAESNVFAFHKSCWMVIGRPRYQDLTELNLKRKSYANTVDSSAYHFDKLMNQQFDYVDLKSSELLMLEDPLTNELSRQNVLDTWKVVKTHVQSN